MDARYIYILPAAGHLNAFLALNQSHLFLHPPDSPLCLCCCEPPFLQPGSSTEIEAQRRHARLTLLDETKLIPTKQSINLTNTSGFLNISPITI